MSYPQRRSPWVWVSLGCIGLIAIVGIFLVVMTVRFMNSEEGQRMQATIRKTESLESSVPAVVQALQTYVSEKGDFPDSLEAIKDRMQAGAYEAITKDMKYTKPAKDAPDTTIILTTGEDAFIQGSSMEVVVQKDFKAYSITKSPLE